MEQLLERFLNERYQGITGLIALQCFQKDENCKTVERSLHGYNDINGLINEVNRLQENKKHQIYLSVHSRYRRPIWNDSVKELTALVVEIDLRTYSINER